MPTKSLKSLTAFHPFNLLLQKYGRFNFDAIDRIKNALEYLFLKLLRDPTADTKYEWIFTEEDEADKAKADEVIYQIKQGEIKLPGETYEELVKVGKSTFETLMLLKNILDGVGHDVFITCEFSQGELSLMETLSKLVEENIKEENFMLPDDKSCFLFKELVRFGNLKALKKIPENKQKEMLKNNYHIYFRVAVSNQHLPVLEHFGQLLETDPDQQQVTIEAAYKDELFRYAADEGCEQIMRFFWELLQKYSMKLQPMMLEDIRYCFACSAAMHGHLELLKLLLDELSDTQLQAMLEPKSYGVFDRALAGRYMPVVEFLWNLATDAQRQAMLVQAANQNVFLGVADYINLPYETIDRLLEECPTANEKLPKAVGLSLLLAKIHKCSNTEELLSLYASREPVNNAVSLDADPSDSVAWQLAIICFRKKLSELTQIETGKSYENDSLFEELSKKPLPQDEGVLIKIFNKLANETNETTGKVLSTFHQPPQKTLLSRLKEKVLSDYQKLKQAETVQPAANIRPNKTS